METSKDFTEGWLDNSGGIVPAKGQASFNNIVFSSSFMLARFYTKTALMKDILNFNTHLSVNLDKSGLYRPKHSHDNSTMLLAVLLVLRKHLLKKVKMWPLFKGANFHPKDVFWYLLVLPNPILNLIGSILSPITALFILYSFAVKHKVRPAWWRDPKSLKYRFLAKLGLLKKVGSSVVLGGFVKTYKLDSGENFDVRYTQNDGKILGVFKLAVTAKRYPVMRFAARIGRSMLVKRYGERYMSALYANYFASPQHPVRRVWVMAEYDMAIDILKLNSQ